MQIGKRIKEIRQQLNMSSRKLALTVGMSTGYLADIERGDKNPTIDMLKKICNVLNISLADFFKDSDNEIIIPEHFKKFIIENKDLSPEQLEQLNIFLKTLK